MHGLLKAAFLAELGQDWAGAGAWYRSFGARYTGTDRVGAPSASSTTRPANAPAADVAQKVVLYEEEQNNPQGKRFVGSAVWRTETVSPGPGLAPELAIRADVESSDILHALFGIYSAPAAPEWQARSRRLVTLLMDGLRWGAAKPAPSKRAARS